MSSTTIKDKKLRPPVVAGLAPYTGTFGKEQITHLLKRTMFGAKKTDIDFFTGKTLTATIDALLTEPAAFTMAQLPLNGYNRTDTGNSANTVADPVTPGETWAYALHNGNYDGQRRASLKAWWVGLMVNQPRSIFEKLVLFWHNHFATEMLDTISSTSFEHLLLLRQHAMGNFKAFTKAVTLDPNMLRYLNGTLNKKTAPDENYARELQELFTLGKGPNSQYTEADVKAAARLLTGWTIVSQTETPVGSGKYYWKIALNATNHDATPKQFSAFYGNRVISNVANTEAGATKELDDLLNMIFAQDEVALYVCRRLYRFFVYYDIDATVEAEVIKPMAALFRTSNYDIKPVLKALFSSEHFFETAMKACLIKSPIENVIGFVREFEVVIPSTVLTPRVVTVTTPPSTITYYEIPSYNAYNAIANALATQAQNLGDPPNVSGWAAYYQEPGYHENWINTDTFPKRLVYSDSLFTGTRSGLTVDYLKFTEQFGTEAEDPNVLITRVLEILYRVPPTAAMIAYLKGTILLGGQASDHYWTDAWLAYKTNPTVTNTNIVKTRLQAFYLFITRNPEYQLA
jgi:uncharacterized protein (DUF1800 family)